MNTSPQFRFPQKLLALIVIVFMLIIIVSWVAVKALTDNGRLPWGFKAALWYGWGDTVFSEGYSEAEFANVKVGDLQSDVLKRLGAPIRKYRNKADRWIYMAGDQEVQVHFFYKGDDNQRSNYVTGNDNIREKYKGKTQSELLDEFGEPSQKIENLWTQETWAYSYSPEDTNYILRALDFDKSGIVISKLAEYYFD